MNRLRRFSQAMNSTAAVCEEALRFDPPLHFFDRYALEPVEVEGIRLRKGEKIGLLLAAANRDPSRWQNADRFDPVAPAASATSPSAPASISASARRSRGWRCRWRCRFSSSGLPKLRLAAPPHYRNSWHFHGLEALQVGMVNRTGRRPAVHCRESKRATAHSMFSFCS